jgi:hypothetical protein
MVKTRYKPATIENFIPPLGDILAQKWKISKKD